MSDPVAVKIMKTYDERLAKYGGSQRKLAQALGIPRTTLQEWLKRKEEILFSAKAPLPKIIYAVPKRATKRWIFTAAQDETRVHLPFLRNLQAYAEYWDAELIVGGFTYNKRLYEDHRKQLATFAPEVRHLMSHRRIDLGDTLTACLEMNTLPTAVSPLSGFEVYTRERSGIFPHAKVQLVAVPVSRGSAPKHLITTGAVTVANYIQKRAGIRAHFHHVIGAVIVEIDQEGNHFLRHLIAEEETGNFQDLTRYVHDGVIVEGMAIESITHGDIHLEKLDPLIARGTWGIDPVTCAPISDYWIERSLVHTLKPRYQFIHDATDFMSRNHHNVKNPHFKFRMWLDGTESVQDSMEHVGKFLKAIKYPDAQTVVVRSNHDAAIERWLREADWKDDMVNSECYLRTQLAMLESMRQRGGREFCALEWAVRQNGDPEAYFLREDESFLVGGVEQGCHGHLGANGSKGSLVQYTRAGPKSNTAHRHSPGIIDGAYCAGTKGYLYQDWNKGLSSWAHSDIVQYPNGTRTIVTMTPDGLWHG